MKDRSRSAQDLSFSKKCFTSLKLAEADDDILQNQLHVIKEGKGLRVETDKPHLVSLGGGRLSTAVTLLPLPEGKTSVGTAETQDIVIQGRDVLPDHCYLVNDGSTVSLHPQHSLCYVDGQQISIPCAISQGCMLCFGRSNYFRFNHPQEARRIRQEFPNGCLTAAPPADFNGGVENAHNGTSNGLRFNGGPRRPESNSNTKEQYRDKLEGANFLSKVSRFEFLSHAKGGTPNGSVKSPPPSSQSSKRTPKFPESGTTYSLQRSFSGFRSSSGSPSPGSTPSPDGAPSPPVYNGVHSVRSRSPSPLRIVEKTPTSTSPTCNGVAPVWQTQPDKKSPTTSYSINSLTRRSKTRQTATPLHNGYTSDDGQPSSPRAVDPPLPRSSSLKYRSSRTKPPIFPFVGIFTRDNKSLSKPSGQSQSTSALSKLKPVPGERDPQRVHRSGSPKTVTFSTDSGKTLTSKRIKLPTLLKFSNNSGDVNHVTPSSSSGVSSAKTTRGGVTILRKEKASIPPSTSDYDTVANCYSSSESLSQQQYSGYDNIDISRNSLGSFHDEDIDPAFNIYDNVDELKTPPVRENVAKKTPVKENVTKSKTPVTVCDREYDTVADNELNTLVAVDNRPDRDYDTVADYEEILTLNSCVPNNAGPPVPNKPPRSLILTLNSGADLPEYAKSVPNKPPRSSLLSLNSCVDVPDYPPPPVPSKQPRCSLSPQSSTEDLSSPWKVNLKERIKPNLQNFKGEKVFRKDTVVTNIYVPGFEPGDECVKNKQADECSTVYTSEASVSDSKQDADSKLHKSCVPDPVNKPTNKALQSGLLKSTNSGSTSSVVEKSKPAKSVKWSDDCIDEPTPPVSKHQQKSSFLTIGTLRKTFKKGNPVTEVVECSESDRDSEVFVEKETPMPRTMSHLRIGVKVLPGGSTVSEKSQSKSSDMCNGNAVSSEMNDKRGVRFSEDCDVTTSDADPCQNGNWDQRLDRSDRDSVDMTGSQRDLQELHLRMIEERKKEQQVAAQEKQRLEDILLMCAEYEKQLEAELSPPPKELEKRSSMTKIKTNGSLTKLTSPSHLQKDDFAFDFKWPRNSSSSNSEQDDSEKDGTIKRRPAVTNGRLDSSSVAVATVTDDAPRECAIIDSASNGETSRFRVNCNGFDSFQPAASPPPIPEPLRIKMPGLFASSVCDAVFSPSLGSVRSGDVGCYGSDSSSLRFAGSKDRVTSSSGVETSSDQSLNGFEDSEMMIQLSKLKVTKHELIQKIRSLKQDIMDVETQENEAARELEMERALLEGEQQNELELLMTEQKRIAELKRQRLQLTDQSTVKQEQEQERIEAAKAELRSMESKLFDTKERSRRSSKGAERHKTERLLSVEHELIECQRRLIDDLEFTQLEAEAMFESERESIQLQLSSEQNDLMGRYKQRENTLEQLDQQQREMVKQVKMDIEEMENGRQRLVEQFDKERNSLSTADKKICELSRLLSLSSGDDNSLKSADEKSPTQLSSEKSSEDYLMHFKLDPIGAPVEHPRKLSQTLVDVEKNRLAVLQKQAGDVIDEERRRLSELKQRAAQQGKIQWEEQRAAQQGRVQWEERKLREVNCNSFESEDSSIGSSATSDKETSLSSGEYNLEKIADMERLLALAQTDKLHLIGQQVPAREYELQALQIERRRNEELERKLAEEVHKREELIEEQIRLRDRRKLQARPLTRFLPVRSVADFDLRQHIETAGHNVDHCRQVALTADACRGYLHKMGNKFKTWHKRWFVFNRTKRSFIYYTNDTESKARGGIYFQAIEEVYVDHLKSAKSPNPALTFCVKTFDRVYYLVAPTAEVMRIWIDVIFSGAEGNREFA